MKGESERLGHAAIGTEHVLRTRRPGVGQRALLALGVDAAGLAAELRRPRADAWRARGSRTSRPPCAPG